MKNFTESDFKTALINEGIKVWENMEAPAWIID